MKKINLFNKTISHLSSGYGFSPFHGKGVRRNRRGVWGFPFAGKRGPAEQPGGMEITPSPFGATPSWKEGERSGRGGLWFAALVALFVATPSFAEPTELDKKTVASKAYVDTKQDLIPASLVQIPDYGGEVANQSLVTYDTTNGIVGNEIGIVTQQLMEELGEHNISVFDGSGVDNLVPTVDAVLEVVQTKQNKIAATAEDYYSVLTDTDDDGVVGKLRIITPDDLLDGDLMLDDYYHAIPDTNAINSELYNHWQPKIPEGTTGTVVTYNGVNANGVQEFSERAVYDPANTYNAQTDATKLATAGFVETKQNKMTCAGWDSDTHTDEHCWLWSIE